jgi:hypothetical protein
MNKDLFLNPNVKYTNIDLVEFVSNNLFFLLTIKSKKTKFQCKSKMRFSMKDKIVLLSVAFAVIALLLGFIGKISGGNLFFANSTWHSIAQTALLFSIAIGINSNIFSKGK